MMAEIPKFVELTVTFTNDIEHEIALGAVAAKMAEVNTDTAQKITDLTTCPYMLNLAGISLGYVQIEGSEPELFGTLHLSDDPNEGSVFDSESTVEIEDFYSSDTVLPFILRRTDKTDEFLAKISTTDTRDGNPFEMPTVLSELLS
jgi:hypothetical protein